MRRESRLRMGRSVFIWLRDSNGILFYDSSKKRYSGKPDSFFLEFTERKNEKAPKTVDIRESEMGEREKTMSILLNAYCLLLKA
ncbi:hypothetical protein CW751_07795 [Brumimicrobium salinarum]|uniref:Uncharacterized protein n=1 Tax=Brumimicrobium salinarum TaxID=2058658 RepID=A0A2I0R257_9FLAO|nr:hypothetical protein CW751_07795 [Brumimicrobium salinarum]